MIQQKGKITRRKILLPVNFHLHVFQMWNVNPGSNVANENFPSHLFCSPVLRPCRKFSSILYGKFITRIRYTLYSYVYNYENVQMITSLSKFDWKETAIDRGGKLDEARDFSLTKLREIRATITSAPNLSSQTILLEVQSFPCDLSIPPRLPRRSSCFPLSRHHPRI